MATSYYYVDPVNGSDANAGTSDATAWQTLSYADATAPNGSSSTIVQINLKSTADHVLTASHIFGGGGSNGITMLRGYDSVANDGGIATIDCDQAYGITGNTWFAAADLYFKNRGVGDFCSNGYSDSTQYYYNCGFNGADGSGISLSNASNYIVSRCYFHDVKYAVSTQDSFQTFLTSCFIQEGDNNPFPLTALGAEAHNTSNMVYVKTKSGISSTYNGSRRTLNYNSIFSESGNTSSGIAMAQNNSHVGPAYGNAVSGFNGTGGVGLKETGGNYRLRAFVETVIGDCDTGSTTALDREIFKELPTVVSSSLFQGGVLPSPDVFASDNALFWESVYNFFRPTDALIAEADALGRVPGAVQPEASTQLPQRHPLARF